MLVLPQRKPTRLKNFDYHTPGAYFITICTQNRACLLSQIEEHGTTVVLSEIGRCVEQVMYEIAQRYPNVNIDKYVIMPNHIHMIIMLQGDVERVSITDVVRMLKSIVGHRVRRGLFQRSFHDHMIRTDKDYHDIWYYIDNNPLTWAQDCFHPASENV